MISRRRFLFSASATAAVPHLALGAAKPLLRIGLAADAQYADIESTKTRFYRASIGKLTVAVDHFNSQPLDFCVHLGDLIDRQWSSFESIAKPLAASRCRFYHVLGNHDFEVLDSLKAEVAGKVGLKERYYAFDRGGFRFVFLDTTEVGTYAHAAGTPEYTAGTAELQRLEATKLPQAKDWNSALSQTQLNWFDATCAAAAARGLRVIVLAHHPVAPAGVHDLWNNEEVLKVISKHRHVVAWINGHNHAGAFADMEGVPFITMHGMVETADTNAYATAELHADRLIITGHGREPSRELVFRA